MKKIRSLICRLALATYRRFTTTTLPDPISPVTNSYRPKHGGALADLERLASALFGHSIPSLCWAHRSPDFRAGYQFCSAQVFNYLVEMIDELAHRRTFSDVAYVSKVEEINRLNAELASLRRLHGTPVILPPIPASFSNPAADKALVQLATDVHNAARFPGPGSLWTQGFNDSSALTFRRLVTLIEDRLNVGASELPAVSGTDKDFSELAERMAWLLTTPSNDEFQRGHDESTRLWLSRLREVLTARKLKQDQAYAKLQEAIDNPTEEETDSEYLMEAYQKAKGLVTPGTSFTSIRAGVDELHGRTYNVNVELVVKGYPLPATLTYEQAIEMADHQRVLIRLESEDYWLKAPGCSLTDDRGSAHAWSASEIRRHRRASYNDIYEVAPSVGGVK